jgi:hypothetical protein
MPQQKSNVKIMRYFSAKHRLRYDLILFKKDINLFKKMTQIMLVKK